MQYVQRIKILTIGEVTMKSVNNEIARGMTNGERTLVSAYVSICMYRTDPIYRQWLQCNKSNVDLK